MKKLIFVIFLAFFVLVTFQSCLDEIVGTEEDDNTPPVAVVDSDMEITIGEEVILDGSDSYDPDEDKLTYKWEFLSKPEGSETVLENPDSINASFIPDARGSYQIRLTVSDGDASHAAALSATADIKILGNINDDMTLINLFEDPNEPDYAVSGVSNINADVTIEPGVVIEFGAGTRMDVESEGSLYAVGTEDDPIIFTGATKTAGSWSGLVFNSNNTNNVLTYVLVEYGGGSYYSNINVSYDAGVKIQNTTSQHSSSYGLDADNSADLREFSNNTFTNNTVASLNIPAKMIGSLDSESSYSGESGEAFVSVYAASVETIQEWPAIDAPYVLDGVIKIKSAVTVKPGAVFQLTSDSRIDVEGDNGELIAIGTADSMIKFVGTQELTGHWKGITILNKNAGNELTYVEVSHGGKSYYSNVSIESNGAAKITNSKFTMSESEGLNVEPDGELRNFSNNTFEADAHLRIPGRQIGFIDANSSYIGTTGNGYVEVYGTSITDDQSWPAIDAPYVVDGVMKIESTVNVKPGAVFKFTDASRIDVQGNNGELIAIGKADSLIKFIGTQEIVGHWKGINFSTKNPNNELTYTEVSHGGQDYYANVSVEHNGSAKITNSTSTMSGTYGIEVASGGEITEFSNNTISSDAITRIPPYLIGKIDENSTFGMDGYILIYGGDVEIDQDWVAAQAPYRIEGVLDILADVTIAPGAVFEMTAASRIDVESGENGGSMQAIGTATDSIKFVGENDVQGYWKGITFSTNTTDNQMEYCTVANGGSSYYSNIIVSYNGRLTLNHSNIRDSENYGVEVESGGEFYENGNSYSNNKMGDVHAPEN